MPIRLFLGLLAAAALASCGLPAMIEGPVALKVQEGVGEYRQVADCAYLAMERRYSSIFDYAISKTDLKSAIYIDQKIETSMRAWRLIITPIAPNRTRIELHALRPVFRAERYESLMAEATACLR